MNTHNNLNKIIIDGVFFQIAKSRNSGIGQVWIALLEEWVNNGFNKYIIFIDRDNTAPKIEGIKYYTAQKYDYSKTGSDAEILQAICDEFRGNLFISTYYTTPLLTPSVFMAYDMIPEVIGANLEDICWKEKHYAIMHASHFISISHNTARDLIKFFPHIRNDQITVAHCGIKSIFSPANEDELVEFKQKYNLHRPYFLLVGERIGEKGYKNAILFFKALSKMKNCEEYFVVCVGGAEVLESEITALVDSSKILLLSLNDKELKIAYSGAIAYICPSSYEGFGLPILEAMACGCPVISARHSSISEIANESICYIDINNVNDFACKLSQVQENKYRNLLIKKGLLQSKKFSWTEMADIVSDKLFTLVQNDRLKLNHPLPIIWIEFRKQQSLINATQRELLQTQSLVIKNNKILKATEKELQEIKMSLFWKIWTKWLMFQRWVKSIRH